MKFVHLTDPHIVPSGARLYGLDPNERLALAVEDINANHADAEFVLITGDIVHHGDPAAYDAFKRGVSTLIPRARLMIGNHDDRAAFLDVFGRDGYGADGFVQYAFDASGGRFICLDTKAESGHSGALCESRIAFLERELAAGAGQRVFIAMHHPPIRLGLPAIDAIALRDEERFRSALSRHGNVAYIFCGHAHRPSHGVVDDVPFSLHRGLNHQVRLSFRDEAGIPGSHEPPAYAVVYCAETSIVIHVHDFLDASPHFNLFDPSAERAESRAQLSPR